MSSSQILQRSIVREKLKAQQPDIYIDVEVDEFYVLDFHRFKQILAAAAPAKEQLRRQLDRVLASQTAETLPAVAARAEPPPHPPPRKRRLPASSGSRRRARHDRCATRRRGTGKPGPRIALALGGGSARGLAHMLMLEAFDELGIKPAIIAGTSMGAICGAAYAAGLSGAEMRARVHGAVRQPRRISSSASPASCAAACPRSGACARPASSTTSRCSRCCCPTPCAATSPRCKIPFVAIAADFYAIEQVVLDKGPLIPALAASCGAAEPRPARGARRAAC